MKNALGKSIICVIQWILGIGLLVVFGLGTIGYLVDCEAGIGPLILYLLFDALGIWIISRAKKNAAVAKEIREENKNACSNERGKAYAELSESKRNADRMKSQESKDLLAVTNDFENLRVIYKDPDPTVSKTVSSVEKLSNAMIVVAVLTGSIGSIFSWIPLAIIASKTEDERLKLTCKLLALASIIAFVAGICFIVNFATVGPVLIMIAYALSIAMPAMAKYNVDFLRKYYNVNYSIKKHALDTGSFAEIPGFVVPEKLEAYAPSIYRMFGEQGDSLLAALDKIGKEQAELKRREEEEKKCREEVERIRKEAEEKKRREEEERKRKETEEKKHREEEEKKRSLEAEKARIINEAKKRKNKVDRELKKAYENERAAILRQREETQKLLQSISQRINRET